MATRLDRAVEAGEIVKAFGSTGIRQSDVARILHVSPRAVGRWVSNGGINDDHYARLQEIREIAIILEDSLTARGNGRWFRAPNRLLGGSWPIDALAERHIDEVRRAAHAFVEGSYV